MKPTERKSAEAIVSNAPETCQGRGISEQRSVLASYMRQHGLTWIKDDATATHLKQSIPTEQRIANYHHGRLGKKAYYTYARIAPSAWWKEAIATMPEGLRWIRLCDGVQHFPLTTIKPGQRQWWKYTETGWKKLRVITRRVDDGVESWITRKFPRKIEGCTIYAGYSGKKRVWLIESGKLTYHADLTGKVMDVTLEDALPAVTEAKAAWLRQAETRRIDELFRKDLGTIRVTLADSRRAGNCIEGSLQFAERKLGITRQEILAGGHLLAIPAKRILAAAAANGQREQAERAVKAAWLRETMVSI